MSLMLEVRSTLTKRRNLRPNPGHRRLHLRDVREERVREANEGASIDEAVTLNHLIEIELADAVTLERPNEKRRQLDLQGLPSSQIDSAWKPSDLDGQRSRR